MLYVVVFLHISKQRTSESDYSKEKKQFNIMYHGIDKKPSKTRIILVLE